MECSYTTTFINGYSPPMRVDVSISTTTFETSKGEVKVGGGGTVHPQELTHLFPADSSSSPLHCYDVVTVLLFPLDKRSMHSLLVMFLFCLFSLFLLSSVRFRTCVFGWWTGHWTLSTSTIPPYGTSTFGPISPPKK